MPVLWAEFHQRLHLVQSMLDAQFDAAADGAQSCTRRQTVSSAPHPPLSTSNIGWQLSLSAILAVFWAAELYFFEQYAIEPSLPPNSAAMIAQIISKHTTLLVLHLVAASAAVLIFSRSLLFALFFANAIFLCVITVYGETFHRALTLQMIFYQAGDLFGVLTLSPDWIAGGTKAAVGVGLLVKCLLAGRLSIRSHYTRKQRRNFAVLFGGIWLSVFCQALHPLKLARVMTLERRSAALDDLTSLLGFVPVWILESVSRDGRDLLGSALKYNDSGESKLIGVEPPFPIPARIAAIQVESLDWRTLYRDFEHRSVTPNFRALAAKSMVYKVAALHRNGSADMDFAFLNRRRPSDDIVNYRILDFPYDNSTVQTAKQLGYRTTALHNFSGRFYNRRFAFAKMGFDEMIFAEEMRKLFPEDPAVGPDVLDERLFQASLARFSAHASPQFHFMITMTSHAPFTAYAPSEDSFIPHALLREHSYLNSIHYADQQFGKYLEALPEGTLVLVWGDHSWNRKAHYHERVNAKTEYVPFLIYQKGNDLALLQKTAKSGLATGGTLSFLDTARFVHSVLSSSAGTVPPL